MPFRSDFIMNCDVQKPVYSVIKLPFPIFFLKIRESNITLLHSYTSFLTTSHYVDRYFLLGPGLLEHNSEK